MLSVYYTLFSVTGTLHILYLNSQYRNIIIINITNEEEHVKQVSLTGTLDTQYTYNVSEFGTYTISITAVISEDLEGERNESIVNIETGKLYYFNLSCHSLLTFMLVYITDHRIGIRNQSGYWMINTTIRVSH